MTERATDVRSSLAHRADPAQPFVTHLGPDGRVELSGASVGNAAAKIANALTSEFDLEPGSSIGLHLPWHWQRVVWLLGLWAAGCTAVPGGGEECDLLVAGPREAMGLPGEVHVVSTHPFGMPFDAAAAAQFPPGVQDVTLLVRAQPDRQLLVADQSDRIALDGLTQAQLLDKGRDFAAARSSVRRLGLRQGDAQWWLPAVWPLITEGSVIMFDERDQGDGANGVTDGEQLDEVI